MKTAIYRIIDGSWEKKAVSQPLDENMVNLVLCFAAKAELENDHIFSSVQQKFPGAQVAFCSTAGEICNDEVLDNSFIAVAMQFEKTRIEVRSVNIKDYPNTYAASIGLAKSMPSEELAHVIVLSDGTLVNGSELVKGLASQITRKVGITGGLAGDDVEFKSTAVGLNEKPKTGEIVAIGLYGKNIRVTHGSRGGWDSFGLEKRITNSSGNVLVELEEENALDLYKKYLGDEAKNLPSSALRFPLSVTIPGAGTPVVRSILSIDEDQKSMTFAGDVPVGSAVHFMKANLDKIVAAANDAAEETMLNAERMPDFALLISCIGRKVILDQRAAEEVKAVNDSFGGKTIMAGFYSYGEISPSASGGSCQLHNQTMTITSFYEN